MSKLGMEYDKTRNGILQNENEVRVTGKLQPHDYASPPHGSGWPSALGSGAVIHTRC
jgi:hypothetical protein